MNKNYDLAVGAKRLEKVTPSLIRTILDRASVLRSEGKPVIPFSAGEPDFNTPEGTEMCMPGDNVEITGELIHPIAMEDGLKFAIREGGRTVGSGRVTEIIE